MKINLLKNIKGSGSITNKEAIRIIKNYKDNGGWNGKTRAIWFPLETLKELVTSIERLDEPSDGKKGSGARLYVGRYENHTDYPKELRGKRTLVCVPTFDLATTGNTHQDDITVEEVKKIKKELENGTYQMMTEPYNHGELCPDVCNGTNIQEGLQ